VNTKSAPALLLLSAFLIFAYCVNASCQNGPPQTLPDAPSFSSSATDDSSQSSNQPAAEQQRSASGGLVLRSIKRFAKDQGEIYSAPFHPSNIKWDALLVAGTAGLMAVDRRAARAIPTGPANISRDLSNVGLIGTSISVGSIWIYGLKTGDEHARETGELTLESLANTFTVYTLMQFASGRERPTEGTGNGRFWIHNGFNSSFPAGHPMFTWAMASVAAHEYPKPWVELLAYGAAATVSATRFTGRMHYPSDILVGSTLGYLVGTHIFHSHCKAGLSEACHHHAK
jgi:membrane-associated phospholipid phosphatase